MKNKIFVRVVWEDAVIYKNRRVPVGLALTKTTGELLEDNKDHLLIKKPITIPKLKFKSEFLYIPKGMVKKVEMIKQKSR